MQAQDRGRTAGIDVHGHEPLGVHAAGLHALATHALARAEGRSERVLEHALLGR